MGLQISALCPFSFREADSWGTRLYGDLALNARHHKLNIVRCGFVIEMCTVFKFIETKHFRGRQLYGPSTFKRQPKDPVFQVERNDMFLEIFGIMAFFPPTNAYSISHFTWSNYRMKCLAQIIRSDLNHAFFKCTLNMSTRKNRVLNDATIRGATGTSHL